MTTTSATSSPQTTTTTSQASRTSASAGNGTQFLTLLTAQLTQQDPLEPMKNEEMMNQIVSLQTMEGLENLRVSIESLSRQRSVRAADLLGTTVTLEHEGKTVEGHVDSVKFIGDQSQIVVNGRPYPESAITTVRQS